MGVCLFIGQFCKRALQQAKGMVAGCLAHCGAAQCAEFNSLSVGACVLGKTKTNPSFGLVLRPAWACDPGD